jgi:hypothetical protein
MFSYNLNYFGKGNKLTFLFMKKADSLAKLFMHVIAKQQTQISNTDGAKNY